jgi:hypothetical protein
LHGKHSPYYYVDLDENASDIAPTSDSEPATVVTCTLNHRTASEVASEGANSVRCSIGSKGGSYVVVRPPTSVSCCRKSDGSSVSAVDPHWIVVVKNAFVQHFPAQVHLISLEAFMEESMKA